MANDILKIKEIGYKEVAKSTHIEAEYLEYMCNKEFEKLKKLNAHGFIKILQREYEVDLNDWLKEFEEYSNEHKGEGSHSVNVSPKIPVYTSKHGSNLWIWILVVILLLGLMIWYFAYEKSNNSLSSIFEEKNGSVVYTNTSVVENAKENLDMQNSTNPSNLQLSSPDIGKFLNEDNSTQNSTIEKNATKDDLNLTTITTVKPFIIISPKKELWYGVKSLDGKYKKSFYSKIPFDINLSRDSIVLFGHANFTLEKNDKNETFNSNEPIRFLVKDGKIQNLTYDEFVKLNKGKEW